jgi:SAM-dependent methyltransferase
LILDFDLRDWSRDADDDELAALAHVPGPVLDVGCGPGRLVSALTERGVPALGIDLAPLALDLATERGAPVLGYGVFERVPGEGRWPTVLLFDGNIGIGGDPEALLRRVRELLAPVGLAIVEVEAPGVGAQRSAARIDLGTGVVGLLPWARVGVDALAEVARGAGLDLERVSAHGDRWFGWLRRPARG